MKREHKTKAWIGAAVVALIVAFIWGNSLLPQTQSRQESDFVLRILQSIFRLDIDKETASHLVRKAAHFTEYALLGFSASALFLPRKRGAQSAVNAMSLCLAVAVLDEIKRGVPSHVQADLGAKPGFTNIEMRERMSGNICRCGAYSNIVDAIADVAGRPA